MPPLIENEKGMLMQNKRKNIEEIIKMLKLRWNQPLLYALYRNYKHDFGRANIKCFSDLEKHLIEQIQSPDVDIHEMELQTTAQIKKVARNNILSASALVLSLFSIIMSFLLNATNDNMQAKKFFLVVFFIIVVLLWFARHAINDEIFARDLLVYYDLKLKCIQKVKRAVDHKLK